MLIHINLNKNHLDGIFRSKLERYGAESAKRIQNGYELATLINSCKGEEHIKELAEIIGQSEKNFNTSETKQVAWRISYETNELLKNLEHRLNSNKSEVIRAIIVLRNRELNSLLEDHSISVATWNINASDIGVIQTKIIVDEILKHERLDFFILSEYCRYAIGRSELIDFLQDQKYGIYESSYNKPGENAFMFIYNDRHFRLNGELTADEQSLHPLVFKDLITGEEIIVIGVKVPVGESVDSALREIKNFIEELQQSKRSAKIIMAGDFRAIPKYMKDKGLYPGSLTRCQTSFNSFSYVYPNGWHNDIDHIFVSEGIEIVKSECWWDFLEDSNYHGLKSNEYIDVPGLPNHAVIYARIEYK